MILRKMMNDFFAIYIILFLYNIFTYIYLINYINNLNIKKSKLKYL